MGAIKGADDPLWLQLYWERLVPKAALLEQVHSAFEGNITYSFMLPQIFSSIYDKLFLPFQLRRNSVPVVKSLVGEMSFPLGKRMPNKQQGHDAHRETLKAQTSIVKLPVYICFRIYPERSYFVAA